MDGSPSGDKVKLPKDVFGITPNDHVIYLSVVAELHNRRQGNSKTKTRTEVRGGGRKPWKQKGRGTARAGTIRSPLWVGGGRVFGPSPKNYHKTVTKKMSRLARKSALSHRAKDDKIRMVEDFTFDAPKTKKVQNLLDKLSLADQKTLLLVPENDKNLYLSGRNMPKLTVKEASCFSAADVMNAEVLLIQKGALTKISEVLTK